MKEQENNRWAFSDLSEAIDWSLKRRGQGIKVTLDPLGEYASSKEQAVSAANAYEKCIGEMNGAGITNGSIAIKLSALGLSFDKTLAEKLLEDVLQAAKEATVIPEIDVEGTPSVPETIDLAFKAHKKDNALVLALQAYLDRTKSDFEAALESGLKFRLVKGAYLGDVVDFTLIQNRFLNLYKLGLQSGNSFDIGTHDPLVLKECIACLNENTKKIVTFGFLKGLADQTKLKMVKDGFAVSEYIPYGDGTTGYIKRREAYLRALVRIKRSPAP